MWKMPGGTNSIALSKVYCWVFEEAAHCKTCDWREAGWSGHHEFQMVGDRSEPLPREGSHTSSWLSFKGTKPHSHFPVWTMGVSTSTLNSLLVWGKWVLPTYHGGSGWFSYLLTLKAVELSTSGVTLFRGHGDFVERGEEVVVSKIGTLP